MGTRLAAVILGLLAAGLSQAQIVVKGKVTDASSGEPLPGVYVSWGIRSVTTTDASGQYKINSDKSKFGITFSFIGYQAKTEIVDSKPGDEIKIDVALEQSILELEQVVVSADRTEQKLSDLTVTLNVIKSDFAASGHISDAQELLNKTPGIEVLDGQASIRGGSGFSYGVGSRVLALVDGLPLLSPDAGGIRWQYLPVEDFQQVEIIKGASSVQYGSSALNGIINFRTREAGNIPQTTFWTEAGLYGSPSNRDWKWWSSPRPFFATSLTHLRRAGKNDIGAGLFIMSDNSYRKYNDEKLARINLRFRHSSSTIKGLTAGINLSGAIDKKTDFILWKNGTDGALIQDTSSVSRLTGKFVSADPFITLKRGSRTRHDVRMRLQGSDNYFPARPTNNASSFSAYTEYQYSHSFTEMFELTAGISGYWSIIRSKFYGAHDGINLAAFAQADIKLLPNLKVLAGVRAEQNKLDSESDKIVPVFRTGINWQPASYTWLRASFGQGYRYPSVAEKFASTTLGSVRIFPNPFVTAESGWSAETGVKQGIMALNGKGHIDLAIFFSQNNDLLEYIFGLYPDGLGFQATNAEQSRIYGVETELMLAGKRGSLYYSLTGGYTFVYPVEYNALTGKNSETYLKYRRKHLASLSLNLSVKKIEGGLSAWYRSRILNIDDVFVNPLTREDILPGFFDYWTVNNTGYFTADFHLGYNLSKKFKITLAVKNFTNTEYMGRPGDIQPPRYFSIRFSSRL